MQEFGLPFVADPAVPKHLSYFLRRHRAEAIGPEGHQPADRPARPDAILFNGGALTPEIVRRRIVEVISSWFADDPGPAFSPRVLTNLSLDLAVAQGAAYYGVVRRGGGIRIGGGTARSFYVGLETAAAEKPWLCVVPRDAQEGEEIAIAGHDFDLLMGQPVVFPLASSSVRPDDKPGRPGTGRSRLDPRASPVAKPDAREPQGQGRARAGQPGGASDRGRARSSCGASRGPTTAAGGSRSSSAARPASSPPAGPVTGDESDRVVIEQSELDAAIAAIRLGVRRPWIGGIAAIALGSRRHRPGAAGQAARGSPRRAARPVAAVGARAACWEPLLELADKRQKSPRHESRWFNLAGFFLRPGAASRSMS